MTRYAHQILIIGASLWLGGVTVALVVAVDRLADAIVENREAVNMIEEAARQLEADMAPLSRIAEEQRCYADRGEWDAEHGCYLQIIEDGQ